MSSPADLTARGAAKPAPRVSVGLPVYNGARYLPEALDSLLSQTFTNFELLVSDNGSSDETAEICRAYARQDERIRYHRSPSNRGAAWNYNRVLALATGKYFKWAAHDDVCLPPFLERCVEALEAQPSSVVLAYPGSRIRWEEGGTEWKHYENLDLRQAKPHERLSQLVLNLDMSHAIFGVIRRDALLRTRGIGSYPSSDWVLLAELALLGEFHEVPECLFVRRVHTGMSREANATEREVAEWFVPGGGTRLEMTYWRLLGEFLAAIRAAPIRPTEALRAYATLVPVWLIPWRKWLALELARLPPQLARRVADRLPTAPGPRPGRPRHSSGQRRLQHPLDDAPAVEVLLHQGPR